MKAIKWVSLVMAALLCVNVGLAWLDPPTSTEKEYFRDNLWNLSKKEFSAVGIAFTDSDMKASTYVYEKNTLPSEDWSSVFKEAFETDPDNWTQVYDYVLNEIKEGDYYETFGYFNLGNDTYWINNVTIEDSSLEGDLISPDTEDKVGSISLTPLFWSFWTGNLNLDEEDHRIVMLNFVD